jgi:hypothetical protein
MNDVVTTGADSAERQIMQTVGTQVVGTDVSMPTADPASIINTLKRVEAPHVINHEAKFTFKAVDKLTGLKRAPVSLVLPVPTWEGLVAVLETEKGQKYFLELAADAVIEQARNQVNDEANPVNDQTGLNLEKLDLLYIASMERVDRRGGGIPKELWELFALDYLEIMPGLQNKPKEVVETALKIFIGRCQSVKDKKPVLARLREFLDLWLTNTTQGEELSEVYEFLLLKITTFMASDGMELLDKL